jgi:glycosyltransferase involved in cell wall biosynthesis
MSIQHAPVTSTRAVASGLLPIRIVQVDLGQPLPALAAYDEETGQRFRYALSLARLHTQPLGVVELALPADGLTPDVYSQYIWNALQSEIKDHLAHDVLPTRTPMGSGGLPCPAHPACLARREEVIANAPFVSVIVCTRDRPDLLRTCLPALLTLHYPSYEIIVVDNAPGSDATARLIEHEYDAERRLRYVREEQPGLSSARNRGLIEARGSIVAYTDDDGVVDAEWLVELVGGFQAAEDVACVTGVVLPFELETTSQIWFEEYVGRSWSSKWFKQRIFGRDTQRPNPFQAGVWGHGASMAFTKAFLLSIGGFDLALGAGSMALSGEDTEAFHQVIQRGRELVFTPTAVVFHRRRRDDRSLYRQVFGYGIGFSSLFVRNLLEHPSTLFDVIAWFPKSLVRYVRARTRKDPPSKTQGIPIARLPQGLTRTDLRGMLYGPLAYTRSLWSTRRRRREQKEALAKIAAVLQAHAAGDGSEG